VSSISKDSKRNAKNVCMNEREKNPQNVSVVKNVK
jgi:hypothetical protein